MSEYRDGILKTGHRGRGSGITQSRANVERALFRDKHKRPVLYVNSNAAGSGSSFADGFSTLNAAAAYAVADSIILVAPTHVETVTAAAGLSLSKAGLTIIGLGNGDRRPQVNFTTAVGADMDVDAAGITIYNVRFTGGVDALTGPIDVNAADFTMIDCVTQDVTGQATDFIVADANADRMALIRWTHRGATAAGADTALTFAGLAEIIIEDAWVDGNFAVAAIENTADATDVHIYGCAQRPCYLRTRSTVPTDVLVTCSTATKGNLGPFVFGRLVTDAQNVTEAYVGADLQFMQPCQIVNADGERGFNTNITASAG